MEKCTYTAISWILCLLLQHIHCFQLITTERKLAVGNDLRREHCPVKH
uniref:Uncharacterized protein n=1 Tax=Anguilla anguilla TaxID=7936 RepID=A0A0E9WY28_ANGAN